MWRAPHLPFFLAAALWAALVPFVWLWPGLVADPARWHAREFLLGVAGAAMAGYLLTALPHWLKEAGRAAPPLAGGRLAALAAVWLAGRLAGFGPGEGAFATALHLAFPLLLSLVLLAAVLRGRLWTRLPVAAAPAALALASARPGDATDGLTPVLVLTLLIALLAGRMLPAFLAARGGTETRHPAVLRDRFFSLPLAAALLLHVAGAPERLLGAALVLAGLAEAARPLVWPALRPGLGQGDMRLLLIAWCWLPVGLCLAGAGLFAGWGIAVAGHLHGLTMGLIGGMILAVQSRAAMRRRPGGLAVGADIAFAFALVQLAAATRLAVPVAPDCLVPLSAGLWSAGWALAAVAAVRAAAAPLPHPVLSARQRPV